MQIIQDRGLSNVRDIMNTSFAQMQTVQQISKEDYFASAIVDTYDWDKINVEELSITERNELIQKLKQSNCVSIYEKLKEAGIENKDIPTAVINLASKGNLKGILESENYIEQIQTYIEEITQGLSIEQVERYLGYYDLKGTGISLRDYQQVAIDNTNEVFKDKRFASVILPTGGGKTYVALTEMLQYGKTQEEIEIENNQLEKIPYPRNDKKMLYLAPSNEILEQTKDRIIENIHGKIGTSGKSKDKIIADVFKNLQFATYQSLITKAGKETLEKQYDFIIFDELHRTGAEKWEEALNKLLENQLETTKVLGITATPRRDADDRNMSDEIAKKLGYTEEEIKAEKHIATKIELKEAIQLGMVVNPKVVSCEYNLLTDGSMENLAEQINEIEDENERKKKLEQYDRLRKNLEKAKGIPEILQENLKEGGKYIVFIPVGGNEEGKDSIDKVKEWEKQISEYLKNSGIEPEYYSMLGAYSDKENERQLEGFESEKSDKTKFMIVMNKLNEGVHVDGVNGILWFRPLDENSKILYKQQIGRVITSVDPDNPPKDEDRPVVMDFANNTERVDIDKEIKNNNRKNDLELLTIVVDWVKSHGDNLPQVTSTSNQERRYAATLYRIQQKYIEYRNGIDNEGITEDERNNIENIIAKGEEIELWDREFERITKDECDKILEVDSFELKGNLHDFVELENEVKGLPKVNTIDIFIEKLEKLQEIGVDVSKIKIKDTILDLVKRTKTKENDEKLIRKIEEIGLEAIDNIGNKLSAIRDLYTKAQEGKKINAIFPTDKQLERLEKLGIRIKPMNTIDEFIEKLEKLQIIGIDVSKIQKEDAILDLVKKTKPKENDDELIKKIEEMGLNPNDPISNKLRSIRKIYSQLQKGKKIDEIPPTMEQINKIEKMGIRIKPKENIIDVFIKELEKLQSIEIDVSKIQVTDTILDLIKKTKPKENDGVLIKKIEEIGLDPNENIGGRLCRIKMGYKKRQKEGNSRWTPLTEEQLNKIQGMGIKIEGEKSNIVDEFIEKIEKLQEIGVDVSKIVRSDTILKLVGKTLEEPEEVLIKKIKEIGLETDDNIGLKLSGIKVAYNKSQRGEKKHGIVATEEQVKILRKMGVWEKKNTIDEFIEKLEKLQEIGVDVSKIFKRDTILKLVGKTIEESEEILIKKIKGMGLEPDYNIGSKLSDLKKVYNKNQRGEKTGGTIATEEQVRRIRSFGIKIGKEITGQSIGQASYTATVQECDEAQADLNKLLDKQKNQQEV